MPSCQSRRPFSTRRSIPADRHAVQEDERRRFAANFWKTVCWLFAALLVPTAEAIGIQVSVLLMVWLVVLITRAALTPPESLQTATAA